MIESERVLVLMEKFKITFEQVFIVWLLYTKDYANIKKYIAIFGMFKHDDFIALEDKGIILHIDNRPEVRINTANMVLCLDVAEYLADIDPDDAFEELFEAYPAHLIINNTKVPAKTLKFDEKREAKAEYISIIKKKKLKHAEIIGLVGKYKDLNNGFATMKLDKFISGRYFEEVEKQDDSKARPRIY